MPRTFTENGMTVDQEREARIKYLNRQLEAAGLPTHLYAMPDAVGHTVNIPTVVLAALANVAGIAHRYGDQDAAMQGALDTLQGSLKIFDPMDLFTGEQDGTVKFKPPEPPAPPKKKRVLTPEHLAKLADGRKRYFSERFRLMTAEK